MGGIRKSFIYHYFRRFARKVSYMHEKYLVCTKSTSFFQLFVQDVEKISIKY